MITLVYLIEAKGLILSGGMLDIEGSMMPF